MDKIKNLKGKNILVTGSTGFKGSWLCIWLEKMGAKVSGLALPPDNVLSNFYQCNVKKHINQIYADIASVNEVSRIVNLVNPDVIFHLAAQAIVLDSFDDPLNTYTTNIMGTINLLEAARVNTSVKSIIVVTSDKCYKNSGNKLIPFVETDHLGGDDPYSSSKACEDIIAMSYHKSFFSKSGVGLATARAGNVVGGGDRGKYRIVPDIIKSVEKNKDVLIRNPDHVRPWQYVLEPIYGYMVLASMMIENPEKYSSGWNFGPNSESFSTVRHFAENVFSNIKALDIKTSSNLIIGNDQTVKEKQLLVLNSEKSEKILGVKNLIGMPETCRLIVDDYFTKGDQYKKCIDRISWYEDLVRRTAQ